MNKTLLFFISKFSFIGVITLLMLTACSKAPHEPKSGEYGKQLIASYDLTPEQIEALNKTSMPKPDMKDRPDLGIGFNANAADNPYRFVIVARGHAITDGEVDLRFIGGVERSSQQGYRPEAYREDDTHSYKANEPVLLVIASDPFSIDATQNSAGNEFGTHAEITERNNFQFHSAQLQIWQGKGSVQSWTRYLGFAVIFIGIFAFVLSRTNLLADAFNRR
ncbi:hypothetical protein CDG60_10485 [Acinetobacter chinensis]|uniref:Uncharacterized protein n=1 Tax=Acinetobacter chinensis TaxID=2004650 RepID=A0A3B7M3M2_9GAMM|nr:hypothetical protein [Acinetobacter chinensis]AXY58447.1 hypothetical protein CDG60_10485 [Acinetobacter chinensis]WOE40231.1 hypothetical protein QSG87_09960 [Acinetobacter chinensis]